MQKRTLFIIIIIFVLFLTGTVGFYLFFIQPKGGGGETTMADFFPFGRGEDVGFEEEPEDGLGESEREEDSGEMAMLRQVTDVPVAGAVILGNAASTSARYIERRTGHIYEVSLEDFERERLTNTTIPAIREAFWQGDGDALVFRYLNQNDVIKTFAARLEPSTEGDTPNQLQGEFIEDEIQFVARSPDGERMFYIFPFETNTIGIISNFNGTDREEVFNSPFNEWLPEWPEEDTISLTTKAASIAEGYLYFLNIQSGELEKVTGGILGLTTNTSPNLRFILYSESVDDLFLTRIYDREENVHYTLPITTLPEKCAWSVAEENVIYCGVPGVLEPGAYPDLWYQGVVSFSDTIWKVNVATRVADQIIDPSLAARTEFDIINPSMSESGETLLFTNKKDSTLWGLTLEQNQ